jgi:adenylate kinase
MPVIEPATLIVLLGGPGAGKGTQAGLLSRTLDVPHVSSGDLVRDSRVPWVQASMRQGELVADDVVTALVFERLEQTDIHPGAVLMGFLAPVGRPKHSTRGSPGAQRKLA